MINLLLSAMLSINIVIDNPILLTTNQAQIEESDWKDYNVAFFGIVAASILALAGKLWMSGTKYEILNQINTAIQPMNNSLKHLEHTLTDINTNIAKLSLTQERDKLELEKMTNENRGYFQRKFGELDEEIKELEKQTQELSQQVAILMSKNDN